MVLRHQNHDSLSSLLLRTASFMQDHGLMAIFWKAWPAAFLWGVGTALGEIPPYATSLAATLAGDIDEEVEEYNEIEEQTRSGTKKKVDPITATKIWMIAFMRRYGFWGVFIMSAWPNALFDLCGICCGASKMPFWDFFGALFLGKACTKVPPQVFIMILLFSEVYRDTYVSIFTTFLRCVCAEPKGKHSSHVSRLIQSSF